MTDGKAERSPIDGDSWPNFRWWPALDGGWGVPVAVRYAYSHNPEGVNLYHRAGLPAVPFRTDEW